MLYVSISTSRFTSRNLGVRAARTTLFEHAITCSTKHQSDKNDGEIRFSPATSQTLESPLVEKSASVCSLTTFDPPPCCTRSRNICARRHPAPPGAKR